MSEPRIIDLRSDTVTLPTPAMREAMASAEVGDDVFSEDPTVRRLEQMAAERMGKEAAVFVASGTMGNLVCLLAHCGRGDEAIVGSEAHVLHYEAGGVPGLGGIQLRTVPNDAHGMLDLDAVEATIRPQNVHFPRTAAVCLENTHNRCGGAVITPEETAAVARLAHRHGVAVHLDGARIFNAAIALGVAPSELTAEVDSVSFCLSKGLSAPVGSLVCGAADFVARARRMRKMVGGGMRQVGVIAAPGIVALETMVERLAEDHQNARLLAQGLAQIPGLRIDPESVQTNIVVVGVDDPSFPGRLREAGVLTTGFGPTRVRMVTHYGITRQDIEEALERVRRVVEAAA
ncbi:MAG: threonine aldolase [Chloroflexi bacterium RBG_16_68_14]|nr:MAG: threonine aldolase [Chloroflexi bacterium RBG_16_68_14]